MFFKFTVNIHLSVHKYDFLWVLFFINKQCLLDIIKVKYCCLIIVIHEWILCICYLIFYEGSKELVPVSSGHCARGGSHAGQVASYSQGHIESNEIDNHLHTHSHLETELQINLMCMFLFFGRNSYVENLHMHEENM